MRRLSKRTREMLRRVGSLLLALAVILSGITLPEMQVQAESAEKTFYYYYEGEDVPTVALSGGVYSAVADTPDYTYSTWGNYYKMTEDAEHENWYSVPFLYDNSQTWGKFEIYTVPTSIIGDSSELSGEPTWVLTVDAYAGSDTDFRTAFDADEFYYKDGTFYASISEAEGTEEEDKGTTDGGTTDEGDVTDGNVSGGDVSGSNPVVTYTDEMEMHFYTTGTEPCIVTSAEIEGLTADGTVWDNPAYLLTSEGNNWWTITTKVPVGAFDLYGDMSNASGWVMKFSNIETSEDGEWAKSYNHFLEGENYYKEGSFYSENPDAAQKTYADLTTLIAEAEALTEANYTETSWADLVAALSAAKLLTEESSDEAIQTAYTALNSAMTSLVEVTVEKTLYYYCETEDVTIGLGIWDGANVISSDAATVTTGWGAKPGFAATETTGWYSLVLKVKPAYLTEATGFSILEVSGETTTEAFSCDATYSNTDIWTQVIDTTITELWIKDGEVTTSNPDTTPKTFADLTALIEKAEALVEADYTAESWSGLTTALTAAKAVTEESTDAVIEEAYTALKSAMNALVEVAVTKTIYYYCATEDVTIGLGIWDGANVISSDAATVTTGWGAKPGFTATELTGWYSLELKVKSAYASEDTGFTILEVSGDTTTEAFACDKTWNNTDLWTLFIDTTISELWIKDGAVTTENPDTMQRTFAELTALIAEAEALVEANYTTESWATFATALTAAKAITESNTADEITAAYNTLSGAMKALVGLATDKTIYYWSLEDVTLAFGPWTGAQSYSVKSGATTATTGWGERAVFAETEEYGWHSITLEFYPAYADEDQGFSILQVVDAETAPTTLIECSKSWSNQSIWSAFVNTENSAIYIKDGMVYTSLEAAGTIRSMLQAYYDKVVGYTEEGYETEGQYAESWNAFVTARTEAGKLLANAEATGEALAAAYDKLKTATEALTEAGAVDAEIFVSKIALSDSFITGADLSSYISIRDSGVVYKDQDGNALSDQEFFDMLYKGGTNWVRIRVWNDPYNGNGNGYGGGNNDLEKAVELGKLATNAGMRVLIDFHYSDFWADPSKQDVPKAWEGYTLEQKKAAVYDYTLDSLNTLKAAGVDVGMVQVGNETNNAICGETTWAGMAEIFNAGSQAVRAFDKNCLVAVHFTDPQDGFDAIAKNLSDNGVDYDVFASSYYPFWHGTTAQLTSSLSNVASTYNKKVMVAETSWTTSWEDGDGHGNTAPKTEGQDLQYAISVQGQANEMRDVVNAVNTVGENGIGVFYWEPAWISKYYAYNADGSLNETEYKKNQELWEQYGSGWASSYSTEYDPSDAGLWYGGSAIDNQAWFDFDGTALPTVQAYALMRTGAKADLKISEVETKLSKSVNLGAEIPWDELSVVKATFNDNSVKEYTVVWDEDEKELISTDSLGQFVLNGTVACSYISGDKTVTEKYSVILTLKVTPTGNVLTNPGFENDTTGWVITYDAAYEGDDKSTGYTVKPTTENPRSGAYGLNFYRSDYMKFRVEQTLTELAPGTYTYGSYIQGGSAGSEDIQYAYVNVYKTTEAGKVLSASYKAEAGLSGWLNWNNPEISGIVVESGDTVVVGMEVNTTKAGAWGSIDDAYLYGAYDVEVGAVENGIVTISNLEAMSGEIVRIAAMPMSGYTLTSIVVSGDALTESFVLNGSANATYSWNAETKTATLTYTDNTEAVSNATFIMPNDKVTVSATFASIFQENVKIQLTDKLVTVSAIGTQWYTGAAIKPVFTVKYYGYNLKAGTDYTVEYQDNVGVKDQQTTAKIILTGKGKFEGTREIEFTIVPESRVDLTDYELVFNDYNDKDTKTYYYTGKYVTPSVSLQRTETVDGKEVTTTLDSKEYNVYYQNNKKLGSNAQVIVIAKYDSNVVKGSVTEKFKIAKCPVSELTISKPSGSTYTGKAVTPVITVKQGNVVLQKGKDYTVTYKNNKNVSKLDENGTGNTYLVVKGKGNYTGTSANLYFNITAKSLKDGDITATVASLAYTGKALTPKVVVKDGKKVIAAKQYTYTITRIADVEGKAVTEETAAGNKVTEAGTYKVVITGKDNYKDTISDVTFQVKDKKFLLSTAKVTTAKQTYTGNKITLTPSAQKGGDLVVTINGAILDPSKYEVEYLDNTNIKAGTAKIRIVPSEGSEYFGSKDATFKIEKRKMEAMPTGQATALDAKKGYLTYEIVEDDIYGTTQYYTGNKLTPDMLVKSVNNGVTKTLTEGIDYKITYSKNVKSGDKAQIKITGMGNYSGSVIFKDVFTVEDRTLDDFIITVDPVAYTGKALKPAVKFVDKATGVQVDLKVGTAYTVTYKNNKNVAGKSAKTAPYVIIKEKGLNGAVSGKDKATKQVNFTITTARIKASDIKVIPAQVYKNQAVEPKLSIKVNGQTLKLNKDYVVSYTDNDKLGKATATITGIGSYSGTVTKTFVIK